MTAHAESIGPLAPRPGAASPALAVPAEALEPILPHIKGPADVAALPADALPRLAAEVRERIIHVIARNGGHFGAPLGAVDIAVALLHVYDVPRDRVVWDVGHQAYAWKILTGRNDRFETIRQYGGLSGFLKREESDCDAFGAGHASTSLSAALGMAFARDQKGEGHHVVAVIGDGAMTGGMAYEALNNAGLRKTKMTVVFNDNELSISENVWVVHKVLSGLMTHPLYNSARTDIANFIKKYSPNRVAPLAHRIEESIKGLMVPGLFFEELGFRYIGPVDGHNLQELTEAMRRVKDLPGPICLHVVTKKGKGYSFAEADPIKYHAAVNMKVETGEFAKSSGPPAFTKVFGQTLAELATENPLVVGITAAMDSGTGLDIFKAAHPTRFYDVGIAEECAVTMAAGMAAEGLRPVTAIYSTFLQRAYDQIIHDVALQKLPVVFVLDRGGLVGADGPTHHGVFDLSYLRIVPNMVVMAARDEVELRRMVRTAVEYTDGPVALRYPRGSAKGHDLSGPYPAIEIGKAEVVREGRQVALVGIGKMVDAMERVGGLLERELGHPVTVVNARFVKPLDETLLLDLARSHDFVFTAEDNVLAGGFGSAVNELFNRTPGVRAAHCFGIPDAFVEHGTPEELFAELGLDAPQMARAIARIVNPPVAFP